MRHIAGEDASKDIIFEMVIDEDARQIEWKNLPTSLEMNMSSDFETLKAYPLMCINKLLAGQLSQVEGLRPLAECEQAIRSSIEIKKTNPFLKYQIHEGIGVGQFGNTFRAVRIADGEQFALKFIKDLDRQNLKQVVKEAQLMAYLSCDELVKCHELYYFNKKVIIILEYMDRGSMEEIVLRGR